MQYRTTTGSGRPLAAVLIVALTALLALGTLVASTVLMTTAGPTSASGWPPGPNASVVSDTGASPLPTATPAPTPDATAEANAYYNVVYSGTLAIETDALATGTPCWMHRASEACAAVMDKLRSDTNALLTTLGNTPRPLQYAKGDATLRAALHEVTAACDDYAQWRSHPVEALLTDARTHIANANTDFTDAADRFVEADAGK